MESRLVGIGKRTTGIVCIAKHSEELFKDDLYLDEQDVELKVVSVSGDNDFQSVIGGKLPKLVRFTQASEIAKFWPPSKSNHRTHIFRKGNWRIEPILVEREGRVLDLETGLFFDGLGYGEGKYLYTLATSQYEITTNTPWLERFSPGMLRSIMQKIVRVRPKLVSIHGEAYDAHMVLKDTFLTLYAHPGSFIPALRKYVRGMPSALKRLAVIMVEDSYTDDIGLLEAILWAVHAVESNPNLTLGEEFMDRILKMMATDALNERKFETGFCSNIKDNTIAEYLPKSFKSDHELFGFVVNNNYKSIQTNPTLQEVMNLSHAVDQHSNPNFIYLIQPEFVSPGFPTTFKRIWDEIVGINFRVSSIVETPFTRAVQKAQMDYLQFLKGFRSYKGKPQQSITIPDLSSGPIRSSRLLLYMLPYKLIKMRGITRDGKSSDMQVHHEDVWVYRQLNELARLNPGVLQLIRDGFRVLDMTMWRQIIQKVRKTLVSTVSGPWDIPFSNRKPLAHQQDALDHFLSNLDHRGHMLIADMGLGKTYVAARYFTHLVHKGIAPERWLYVLPSGAIETVKAELTMEGYSPYVVDGRKGKFKGWGSIAQGPILVRHRHLRLLPVRELTSYFLTIDEFHKLSTSSQASSIAFELASSCVQFMLLSGTVIRDKKNHGLIRWLSLILDRPAKLPDLRLIPNYTKSIGINIDRQSISVPVDIGEMLALDDFHKMAQLCTDACIRRMAKDVMEREAPTFVAVGFAQDAEYFKSLVPGKRIVQIDKDTTFNMDKDTGDIDIVLTTKGHVEGYSLAAIDTMFSVVYPSNQADRSQLDGRINRIGQRSSTVHYKLYHAGILTLLQENYNSVKQLEQVVKDYAWSLEN